MKQKIEERIAKQRKWYSYYVKQKELGEPNQRDTETYRDALRMMENLSSEIQFLESLNLDDYVKKEDVINKIDELITLPLVGHVALNRLKNKLNNI